MSITVDIASIVVPFPPSTSVDKIIHIHLKNGTKSNKTLNSFLIYRTEYSHVVAKYNLELKDVSKFAKNSWKNEPGYVKNYYKQMAEEVKKTYKEKGPLCFIHNNHVTLDTSLLSTNQNSPPPPLSHSNTEQNADLDIEQNSQPISDNFINECMTCLSMDEDEFMNSLSKDLALTYKAIIGSLI